MPSEIGPEDLGSVDGRLYLVCATEEGRLVKTEKKAALAMCKTLSDLMEDADDDEVIEMAIPVQASFESLMKVFEYCEYRVENTSEPPYKGKSFDEPVLRRPVTKKLNYLFEDEWDKAFMIGPNGLIPNGVVSEHHLMINVMLACNFIHCEWLKDLCVCATASFVMDRSVDAVRSDVFNLPPSSEAERKAYREAHQWIDDLYNIDSIVEREERRLQTATRKEASTSPKKTKS
eukprot:TRINITY_DN15123_c0_g1_i1.p1 TRINITY_DN15123_c0_g1~~TRINITY_DN15123_c0_g1_i1.p1  ORF type:complete len:246 (+),score=51.09 TRINITY_DN15123_c0_g1_i1:45-740(+)